MSDERPAPSTLLERLRAVRPDPRQLLAWLGPDAVPLDLQIVGRTLFHAAVIGIATGLLGAAFFAGLEVTQRLLLEDLAGYRSLRAHGERFLAGHHATPFRPWLLVVLPALGALVGGALSILAPETRGGGGDPMIDAFHHQGGAIRRRVIWAKALSSIATLGAGGAGGREGPTMHIGGAIGATVGRLLRVGARERRVLMVAGVAGGISAVFRTPLGAALLAVEILYRDDFEAEALIPSILASVVSYSVVLSIFGESTLFGRAPRYPFHATHLPLYALLALAVALLASLFVRTLRAVGALSSRLPVAPWARPALGGLALGALAVPVVLFVSRRIGVGGQGLGILGGGYGAAQMAISGSRWLPAGWAGVELLLLLCVAKLLASSLTIGSGGSAGDFAPSLALGALLGGAFGRAAQLLVDPGIDPGAFALVGMGTFYGAIAHVPISSLILVSELAGSYDLLVPLMLAVGIASVALRGRSSLYRAQVTSRRDSPVHRASYLPEQLHAVRVGAVVRSHPFVTFRPDTPAEVVLAQVPEHSTQSCFPVVDAAGLLVGIVLEEALRHAAALAPGERWLLVADLMQAPVSVPVEEDLRVATWRLMEHGLRELPVTDPSGRVVGLLDEADTLRAYFEATRALDGTAPAGGAPA